MSLADKIKRRLARVLNVPDQNQPRYGFEIHVLDRLFDPDVGRAYGLDRDRKQRLVEAFQTAHQRIESATNWIYAVVLATEILNIPPQTPGTVVECGCWKGAMTACLSLVCQQVGRKLIVCDSFAGLPEDDAEIVHDYPHLKVHGYYDPGMYAAGLDEVRANVDRWGESSVCQLVPGFFNDSLKTLTDPVCLAFLDVDLTSSLQDCIQYLWPLLNEGGLIYTDDSCDMECVRVWFDNDWWQLVLGQRSPGYVGSGCGLPLNPGLSSLGYALKTTDPRAAYGRVSWLRYRDASGDDPHD